MDRREPDVVAVVKKLKDRAQASPWIPVGVVPQEHYHHFPKGLSLCFTQDIIPMGRFWHLSIARTEGHGPTQEEIDFWRRAFFEEAPLGEVPGLLLAVHARHFFWRVE